MRDKNKLNVQSRPHLQQCFTLKQMHFFALKQMHFFTLQFILIGPKKSVSSKLRLFLIDNDEMFPMQSSVFTKSLYFGSHLKKLQQNKNKILFFKPKNKFL